MSPAGDGLRTGVHTVVMSGGGTPREREAGWSEGPLPWWSCFPFDRGASPAIRCTTAGAETRNAPGPTRRATAWRRAGPGSTAARAACRARRGRSRVPPVCVRPLPRRRLRPHLWNMQPLSGWRLSDWIRSDAVMMSGLPVRVELR